MHNNRNKKALRRVEKGMMKANRTRNIFAIVAVVLTTFMITTIFSLGINYKENMDLTQVRMSGTNANVTLAMPTNEQEKEIRDLDYVKTVGTQYMIGSVAGKNEADRDLAIAMQYYDNTEWEKHYKEAISNINGKYPKKENEIMLSEDALSQLGIKKPKLNMEIPLSYVSKDGEQNDTFTLSGWFRSYTSTGMAFLSESYCQEHGYTMKNSGVLSMSLENPKNDVMRLKNDITLNKNQEFQSSVSLSSPKGSVYAMIILLVFFIIGSGYLLIYNVLYISISRDTRFYGLIKTLGTTEKQIKTLVKRQALTFGCIGIPIGVILAGVLSFGIVPVLLENAFDRGKSLVDAKIFFHPSIFILSILFSALTVWISCNAPAKIAGKISPVEALRYQNFASSRTKSRNSANGGKLYVMAYHNVFRDKKRALLVFMSLFMGITMILGINGIIRSIKVENYIKKYMDYNFEYTDVQFAQPEQSNKEVQQFDEQFVEEIKQIDGVKNVSIRKKVWAGIDFDETVLEDFMKIMYEDSSYKSQNKSYKEMVAKLKEYANAGDYGCYITTLDDKAVEEYNTKHPDTPIDVEAFKRGETAIAGTDNDYFSPNAALIGKTLSLSADTTDGKPTDYLIDGAFHGEDYDDTLTIPGRRKFIEIVPDIIYVSEAGMERLTNAPIISGIGVNIKDMNQVEQIDNKLQTLNNTLTKTEWNYVSPVGIIDQFNQLFYSMNLLGNGAAVLFIVIGLINFINVMLTGVVARKNEFAIMESIGTSQKQIKKILTLEGGIYALVTTALIMTFGNAFLLLVADAVPHMIDYAKFEYPFALVICLIFVIFIICLSVPAIVYHVVSKETVIERLHDFGN